MPVVNKMLKVAKSLETPLPSVFQAVEWAYNPAGVPMSILTGKLAADKVQRNWASRKLKLTSSTALMTGIAMCLNSCKR